MTLVLAAVALLLVGCSSDSKVNHLVLRARAQVAELEPHPDLVPTPLAGGVAAPALSEEQAQSRQPAVAAVQNPTAATSSQPATGNGQAAGETKSAALAAHATGDSDRRTAEPAPSSTFAASPVATGAANAATAAPDTNAGTGLAVQETEPAAVASTETSSPAPSETPAPTATPTATAPPAYVPAAPSVTLTGLIHYWQNWNNCGPATMASDLSYFGSKLSQTDIAATLRPDPDDKNVNPGEMAAYAQAQGFQATARINGDADRLRLLLSNGVPVMVETWMEPKPNDGMGHYRLLVGYDDATRQWIAYDSYDARGVDPNKPYTGIRMGYDELDALWRVFDRAYVVVYPPDRAAVVEGILGNELEDNAMWLHAETRARADLQANQADAFGWFNLGTDLVGLGRFQEAAAAFDQARRLGLPWRMLWYQFGPFEAYMKTGRYQEVVALADATLKTTDNIEELWYWRGLAQQALGDLAAARQSWQRAVQLNRNYTAPAQALASAQ